MEGEEQLISTGVPVEALRRMSIDETDCGQRSFGEPQESSEEELGMAFSPGKMVDDIVGADNDKPKRSHDHDKEEIIFSGRATRKQLYLYPTYLTLVNSVSRSNPVVTIPSPILLPPRHVNTPSPLPSPITAVAPEQQPKTVVDLMLHAFPKAFSGPSHSPLTLSPHPQTVTAHQVPEDQYTSLRSSPQLALHDTRRREESAVGVIGQGRASPRRAAEGTSTTRNTNGGSPRWSGGFSGL